MFTLEFKLSNFLDSFILDSSFLGNGLLPAVSLGILWEFSLLVCMAVGFKSSNIVISQWETEAEEELINICPGDSKQLCMVLVLYNCRSYIMAFPDSHQVCANVYLVLEHQETYKYTLSYP